MTNGVTTRLRTEQGSRFVEILFEISMVVGFSTFNLVFFGEKNLENLIKSNKEIHVQLVNDILGGL